MRNEMKPSGKKRTSQEHYAQLAKQHRREIQRLKALRGESGDVGLVIITCRIGTSSKEGK